MAINEKLGAVLEKALKNAPAELACVYWHPLDQVAFESRERLDTRARVSLERMLRYRAWQWLKQNHVQLEHRIVQPEAMLLPDQSRPVLLMPLLVEPFELAGFVMLVSDEPAGEASESTLDALEQLARESIAASMAGRDARSGLLDAASFDRELGALQRKQPSLAMRSCLLRIHFDTVSHVRDELGAVAAATVFEQQLAILETRLRQRDLICRRNEAEIAVLLRQCELPNAERLLMQFHRLMNGYRYENESGWWEGLVQMRLLPMHEEDEIAAFLAEPFELRKPERAVRASEVSTVITLPIADRAAADRPLPAAEPQTHAVPSGAAPANVISLGAVRGVVAATEGAPSLRERIATLRCHPCVSLHDDRSTAWFVPALEHQDVRVEPGRAICHGYRESLCEEQTRLAGLMLEGVFNEVVGQGVFQYQRELDLVFEWPEALQSPSGLSWLLESARRLHIPPSQLVPMIGAEQLMRSPRRVFPLVLRAWREGLQVMLDVSDSDDHASHLLELLPVNHVHVSSRVLRRAMQEPARMGQLQELLEDCRLRGTTSLCGLIRTDQERRMCMTLGIDYGFGQQCGRSRSLRSLSA